MLGFRTIEEMIGRVDKLEINPDVLHYKSRGLDLSPLLTPATSLNENHSGVTKNFEQVRRCPRVVPCDKLKGDRAGNGVCWYVTGVSYPHEG